jgi:Tfp pilus assembly ATPase PilU
VDLLYNAVIGILDYFNVITHKNVHLFKVNDYIPEAALTISGICLVSFLIAFPVCFIQITNLIKKQTTHERFAFVKSGSHLGTSTSMPSMTLIRGSEESMENIRNQEKPIKKRHKSKRCCFDSTPVEQEMLIA